MAFGFAVSAAWRMNIDNPNRNFMTYDARLNVTHRIDDDGKFVFATKIQGVYINNRYFEFFQGADLGGNNDLRSFRNNRFWVIPHYFRVMISVGTSVGLGIG